MLQSGSSGSDGPVTSTPVLGHRHQPRIGSGMLQMSVRVNICLSVCIYLSVWLAGWLSVYNRSTLLAYILTSATTVFPRLYVTLDYKSHPPFLTAIILLRIFPGQDEEAHEHGS